MFSEAPRLQLNPVHCLKLPRRSQQQLELVCLKVVVVLFANLDPAGTVPAQTASLVAPVQPATLSTTTPAIPDKMTFRELDSMLNKLIGDFEQQQHNFKQQIDEINTYDLVLADNEDRVCQFYPGVFDSSV